MQATDVIVIGAGQAGLATSHCLSQRGIDHIVLDRGRVAERWRSERWDSLRLLTPNWQSRLPGFAYTGPTPHGFMSMPEVVQFFERYASFSGAPIQSHTRVSRIDPHLAGFRVRTDRGDIFGSQVVIATGHCDVPFRPGFAAQLATDIHQLTPSEYKNPERLPPGGVLVVGASASGAQLADEIARSGRPVTLAVGRHTRLPRRYRGADVMWWLDQMGKLDEPIEHLRDVDAARGEPSLQLIGSDEGHDLDLNALQRAGVRLCGRVTATEGPEVRFADDLQHSVHKADRKLVRLLSEIDRHADRMRQPGSASRAARPEPIRLDRACAPRSLNLRAEGIGSVLWATGFRRDYHWLRLPVLDARGEIVQRQGVTPFEGLYTVGLRLQRTRKSSFIDGVAADAEHVARRIASRLGARSPLAA